MSENLRKVSGWPGGAIIMQHLRNGTIITEHPLANRVDTTLKNCARGRWIVRIVSLYDTIN